MGSLRDNLNKGNKFDGIGETLDKQEEETRDTKHLTQKRRRGRPVGAEKRQAMPIYIPISLYSEFEEVTNKRHISKNAAVVEMIRQYVLKEDREDI